MATFSEALETLLSTFNSSWNDYTVVDWPNQDPADFNTPEQLEQRELDKKTKGYVAIDIDWADSEEHAIGGQLFNREGLVTVRTFAPIGKRGLEISTELVKRAMDAFEGKTVDGVHFSNVAPNTVGPDKAWFQVNVRADFEFQELKSI